MMVADILAGLVCEGVTDYIILERLLKLVAEQESRTIGFKRLHPAYDATSGATESGGWYTVLQWCTRNPPADRRFLFEVGDLFATASPRPCDMLILHLDADICEKMLEADLESLKDLNIADLDLVTPAGRGAFVTEALSRWLNMDEEDSAFKRRHILAPAVECSEAWLIAYRDDIGETEADREIMAKFVATVCETLNHKPPTKLKNFGKNEIKYRRFIDRAPINAGQVRERCPHFDMLCKTVFSLESPTNVSVPA